MPIPKLVTITPVIGKTHDEFMVSVERRKIPIAIINRPAAANFIGPYLSESCPENVPTTAIDIAPEAEKNPIW